MSSSAEESIVRPSLRSFVTLSRDFALGAQTPSSFLEQCLQNIEAYESRVKAFVVFDKHRARARLGGEPALGERRTIVQH